MALVDHQQLIFQQTKNFSRNDFAILDLQGQQLAHVETGGSVLGRMFMGARELRLYDGPHNHVLTVLDPPGLGRDRYEIRDPQGNAQAYLVKNISFFRTKVTVEIPGETIVLNGNVWDFNFQFQGQHGLMATVSREWSGLGRALMGHSTYQLSLAPLLTAPQRLTIIGSLLALDLIREKQEH